MSRSKEVSFTNRCWNGIVSRNANRICTPVSATRSSCSSSPRLRSSRSASVSPRASPVPLRVRGPRLVGALRVICHDGSLPRLARAQRGFETSQRLGHLLPSAPPRSGRRLPSRRPSPPRAGARAGRRPCWRSPRPPSPQLGQRRLERHAELQRGLARAARVEVGARAQGQLLARERPSPCGRAGRPGAPAGSGRARRRTGLGRGGLVGLDPAAVGHVVAGAEADPDDECLLAADLAQVGVRRSPRAAPGAPG